MNLLVTLLVFIFIMLSSRLAFVIKKRSVFLGQYFFATAFIFILIVFTYTKYGVSIFLLPVFLSCIAWVIFIAVYHSIIEKHMKVKKEQCENIIKINDSFENISRMEKEIEEEITSLNFQLDQTSSIYKATLKMSSTLEFQETLDFFVNSISSFQGFKKLFLLVSIFSEEYEKSEELVSFVFESEKKTIQQYPTGIQEEILMTRMKAERSIQIVSDCLAFGIHPSSFDISRNFKAVIVPLFFQNDFLGVLIYFNDRSDYLNQLELLTLHFSMELHKSRLYEKIKKLSTIDSLSSTYLKRHFFPLFDDEIVRHAENKQELALILIDIDFFKQINDKNGHLVGDIVIREVAKEIKLRCREEDLIGRFGGDEFMIVLPGASSAMALHIADRISSAIKDLVFNQGTKNEFKISISVGISMFPKNGKNRKELFQAVDEALYKAKECGRNKVVLKE